MRGGNESNEEAAHLIRAQFGALLAAEAAEEGLGLAAERLAGAHEVGAAHVEPDPL